MVFDAERVRDQVVEWTRGWFEENGRGCNAVIGISGGQDSSVTAALCVEALGKERVVGVLMPNGEQHDIDVSRSLTQLLGIRAIEINIRDAHDGMMRALTGALDAISAQTATNLPPRLRMAALYAVAQSVNGRVANTSNLSEDWVGYSTRYGDSVGDFSPLSHLTVTEIKQIGYLLGLPKELVNKTPIDGLCGKTDEENLGFTYAELDVYIRTGEIADPKKKESIDRKHAANLFKLQLMPSFPYEA